MEIDLAHSVTKARPAQQENIEKGIERVLLNSSAPSTVLGRNRRDRQPDSSKHKLEPSVSECPNLSVPMLSKRNEGDLDRRSAHQKKEGSTLPAPSIFESAIKCAAIFHPREPVKYRSVRLGASLLEKSCATFSDLRESEIELHRAFEAAANLQMSLKETGCVHLIIEKELSPRTDLNNLNSDTDSPLQKRVSIMPIFSPSLVTCFVEDSSDQAERSSFASTFVHLFAQAEMLSSKGKPLSPAEKHEVNRFSVKTRTGFELPLWFTNLDKRYCFSETPAPRGKDILVDPIIYSQLKLLPGLELVNVYGSFFMRLHEQARLERSLDYKHAIVYYKWTPEWLRVQTNFLVGRRNNEEIRFTLGRLPTKRWCTKKEGRDTCRAILAEWLRRELGTRDVLVEEFSKIGVTISPESLAKLAVPTIANTAMPSNNRETTASAAIIAGNGIANSSMEKNAPPKFPCLKEIDAPLQKSAQLETLSSGKNCFKKDGSEYPIFEKRVSSVLTLSEPAVPKPTSDEILTKDKHTNILVTIGDEKVTFNDIKKLNPGQWLNSVIVNSFFSLIQTEKVHVMSSWFYTIMEKGGHEDSHQFRHVAKWVDKGLLESLDMILIPVHSDELKHWAVVHVQKAAASVTLYDSLPSLHAFESATELIAKWCEFLHKHYKLESWPSRWSSIQGNSALHVQSNSYDCGVHSCINAFYLSREVPSRKFPVFDTTILRAEMKKSILSKTAEITNSI